MLSNVVCPKPQVLALAPCAPVSARTLSTFSKSVLTMAIFRKPLQQREVAIIRNMKKKLGLPVTKIATAVERTKRTVYKALDGSWKMKKRGRREALTKKDVTMLVRRLKAMIKQANGRREVTLGMLKKATRCKANLKCIRKNLHQRGIRFRRLREKCLLKKSDVKARCLFAQQYKDKTAEWWLKNVDFHWGLKNFPVYTSSEGRDHAARREVRGAYRKRSEGLEEWYVVQPKNLRYNPGVRSCRIAAGVGKGGVLLWHEIKGAWTGAKAAELYAGPVKNALIAANPRKRRHTVLEDNDPTGFKSKLAAKAKAASKLTVFAIPPRSPDLNVCDYALWQQVTRNMRRQEKKFKKSKRESRAEYVDRLRKTAKRLSVNFVRSAIMDMRRRCQRLFAAKGRHFEEGGRGK